MKISFYEHVIRQLIDDEFHEVAELLKARISVKENRDCEFNWLFRLYEENFGRHFYAVTKSNSVDGKGSTIHANGA